jgi:excisionase family DNA binding protein
MTAHLEAAPRLLHSVDHAAELLDVSKSTMKTLLREGELASVMVRGRRLVPHEALVEFVARLRRSA